MAGNLAAMNAGDDQLQAVMNLCDALGDQLAEMGLFACELIGNGQEVDPKSAGELSDGLRAVQSTINELASKFDQARENR